MSGRNKPKPKRTSGDKASPPKDCPPDLDADHFAEKWNASTTLKALAENIGVAASTCALVAARLRKAGYEMKWFRKGRPRLLKI